MRIAKYILSIVFLMLLFPVEGEAQLWANKKKKDFNLWTDWNFNVNFGQTSFYGDVSLYDDNFSEKLSKESDWAYGVIVRKEINPVMAFGVQVLSGKLKGENKRAFFEGEILEYNLNGTINVVNLLLPYNNSPFFLYGVVGIGQFLFNSKKVLVNTPTQEIETEDTGVPEFVYMFGSEGVFRINHFLDINAGIVLRQARNDKIDVTKNKDDWDYYSYLFAGVTYNLRDKSSTARDLKKIRGRYPMRKK